MDEIYEIVYGDEAHKIAEKYGMTLKELMDLNPDYKGFIDDPTGDTIKEGDTLNIKKQKPINKVFDLFKSQLREDLGIKGDKKFKETLVGELLGGGKPFIETGIGKLLGGGKPIGETAIGLALGLDKPFKETRVGKTLGGGKPFKETGVGRFLSTEETPVLDAIPTKASNIETGGYFDDDTGKWVKASRNPLADIDVTSSENIDMIKAPGQSTTDVMRNLMQKYTLNPDIQKRGGGLIKKYDDGGMFGDFFTNLISNEAGESGFAESTVGQFLGSEDTQKGLDQLSTTLKTGENKEVEFETEKERLESIADESTLQGSHYVDYLSAGTKAATGNIPGAILDMGKMYLDIFKRKKQKRKAEKELAKLEKKEESGSFGPSLTADIQEQFLQSQKEEELDSKLSAYENIDDDVTASAQDLISVPGFMKKGGMVNSDAFSFLSDSYKRYLSEQYGSSVKRKKGGMVYGPSHEQGGVKYNVGGKVVELEGGEAVINKKSTQMFRPILSELNQAGGGVSFARGGLVNPNVNKMIQRLIRKNR
jgi:hypothetical protein